MNWIRQRWAMDEWKWSKQIGRLKMSWSWRAKSTKRRPTLGRFGGCWEWKVGVQIGGRTVLLSLLVCELMISIKRRETKA